MNTPKSLTDIRGQQHLINISSPIYVQSRASKYFRKVLNDKRPVHVRFLFSDTIKKQMVYEAYTESSNVDHLYIVAKA